MRYMYALIMHELRIAHARCTGYAINRIPAEASLNSVIMIRMTLKMGIYANTPDTGSS